MFFIKVSVFRDNSAVKMTNTAKLFRQILFVTNTIPAVLLDGLSLGDDSVVQMAGSAQQVEGHPVLVVLLNLVQSIFGKFIMVFE